MRSVLFLVGLVLGFLGGVGTIIYLQQRSKDTGEMSIVFAQKSYYETPAVVTISGTLTGEGLGYPNNTYSIACFQDRKECWMTSVEAIGGLQIARMDSPYAYDIRKWSPYEVIAGDDGTFGCFKTTITIDRQSQQVLWVEEPVNQTQVMCAKSENKIRIYDRELARLEEDIWKEDLSDFRDFASKFSEALNHSKPLSLAP
jgi:hypothetical protein